MNPKLAAYWDLIAEIYQRNKIPIRVVPLVRGNPKNLSDSFEIEVLALEQPAWILGYEAGSWIRTSGSSYVESRELNWESNLQPEQLAILVCVETLWEFHISEPGQFPISWELFEDNLSNPIKTFWVEQSSFPGVRAIAIEAIETWNELIEIYGFEGGELTTEYLDDKTREVNLEDYSGLSAGFRNSPRIAVLNNEYVGAGADQSVWKAVRRQSVSATDARFLIKLNGQPRQGVPRLMYEKIMEIETPFVAAFERGIEREPFIAEQITNWFTDLRLTHNRFLFVGENYRHVATPDMVGDGVLCEIKVLSKPLKNARSQYFDQMQWQMHVTGAERVLFAVENRYTEEIELEWIERDESRIKALVTAADEFLVALDSEGGKPAFYIDGAEFDYSLLDVALETDHLYVQNKLLSGSSESSASHGLPELLTPATDEVIELKAAEINVSKPTFKKWNKKTRTTLLSLYLGGADCYVMSEHMGIDAAEVVSELSRLVLGATGELVDESAPRFGSTWSAADHDALTLSYRLGSSLKDIASSIGRDQLGAAFVIFSRHSPPVPKKVIKKYLDVEMLTGTPLLPKQDSKEDEDRYSSSRRVKFLDFGVGDLVKVYGAGLDGEEGIVKQIDFGDDTAFIEIIDGSSRYWFSFEEIQAV